jgi:hypothetical protein
VLQAVSEDGLNTWLGNQGFVLNEATEAALADYVAAESWFLAATVDLGQDSGVEPTEEAWLSALQLSYADEGLSYSLPIRLGTASSAGEQDLVLFVVNDVDRGAVAVSNYPDRSLEDECMLPEEAEDFGHFYQEWFQEGIVEEGRATWTLEYGWPGYVKCDPCPDGSFSDNGLIPLEMLEGLGWQGEAEDAYLSRLHMRYSPEAIDQDLSLYPSNRATLTIQERFIQYSWEMESRFPVCGVGWVPDPGSCDAAEAKSAPERRGPRRSRAWWGVAPLLLLGLGAVRRWSR